MTGQATGQTGRPTVVITARLSPEHRAAMKTLAKSNYRSFTQEIQYAVARHLAAAELEREAA